MLRKAEHSRDGMRARRGIAFLYMILAMIALLGIASLAIDWCRVQLAKSEIQAATDAAARYGATGFSTSPATVRARVAYAAALNTVDGTSLIIDPSVDVKLGTWNATTGTFIPLSGAAESSATAIRVTGRRIEARGNALPLHFARILGMDTCDLSASAIVSCGSQANDIFLIQDITTSFQAELPSAKAGLQDLLDALHTGGSPSRMAVSVHTGWGKTLAPLTTIASNYTYLSSKISSIQLAGGYGMPVASGTDISVGFDQAITAYTAAGYVAPAGMKSVVLVSDGQPSQDADGKNSSLSDWQLKSLAQSRADTLWSKEVHVYVIFMDTANDTAAATFLKTLTRGDGDFKRVQYASELPAALTELTKKLGGAQLVK